MGKNVNLRSKDWQFLMILACTLLISISMESASGSNGQLTEFHYKYKCVKQCSNPDDLIFCADAAYKVALLGSSARINCSDGQTGTKKRTCETSEAGVKFGEVEDFCVSHQINNILQSAQNSTEVAKQLPTLVKSLANITENLDNTTPGNLAASLDILKVFSSANVKSVSESTVEGFFVLLFGIIMDEKVQAALKKRILSKTPSQKSLTATNSTSSSNTY
ncbi:uncharacterized protein LOC134358684 isoform X2 [Mobula hypostoma]|uniref:uncharacterized protein LOC134358684 isoform X2 n=1 Tax=Mobula hypostoma TaxID=723540 RepID=UPI002FC3AC6E